MPVDQIVNLLISVLVSISTLIIVALGLAVIFGMSACSQREEGLKRLIQ